jgi:hypothetical protein
MRITDRPKYFDRFQLNEQTQDRWVLMLANKWYLF